MDEKIDNKGLSDDEVKELVIKQLEYYNDKENYKEIDILKIIGFILLFNKLATEQEYINYAIDIPIIRSLSANYPNKFKDIFLYYQSNI